MKADLTRRAVDLDPDEFRSLQKIQERMKTRTQADTIRKCIAIVSKMYALGEDEEIIIVNSNKETTKLLLI